MAVRTHEDPATVFLFQNHLGSTVAGFDDTADTALKQYYYPYGAERGGVGTLPIDQRYTGQTSDATGAASGDTGLVYYQARYYDPDTGAFTAADTIVPTVGLSVGLNRYAYVAGNPANLTDPDGEGWVQTRVFATGTSSDVPRGPAEFGNADLDLVFDLAARRPSSYALYTNSRRALQGAPLVELSKTLGLTLEVVGDATHRSGIKVGGSLLHSAPGIAEATQACIEGRYRDCASTAGETGSEAVAAWYSGIGGMVLCGPACALAFAYIGSEIAGGTYRAVSRYLGTYPPDPAGPAADPFAPFGAGAGSYGWVLTIGGGGSGLHR